MVSLNTVIYGFHLSQYLSLSVYTTVMLMAKNLFDLRFGIKRADGYVSIIWRLWVTRSNDVYLTTIGMSGVEKYSFHKSGICRNAFTKEHGTPATMKDRAISKWKRTVTPPKFSGRAARVAWIAFPTDYLSKDIQKHRKPITWIPAAPANSATYIELAFTSESKKGILTAFQKNDRHLVCYVEMSNKEYFILNYYHADWKNRDLRSPASENSIFPDLLFSADDPNERGRPIRIRFGPQPRDGDALILQELGGYKINEPNNALKDERQTAPPP